MKALDKERNRRYETANGFAADVERFLSDEPVEACPPTAAYRLRKFVRRNKASMIAATVTVLALIAVAIGSTIAAGRFRNLAQRNADLVVEKDAALTTATAAEATAREAQQDAEDARDQEKALREDAQQQRERAEANFALARSAVDEFLNEVTRNELLTVPGLQPLRQQLLSQAMEFYGNFTQDKANASELLVELAAAHFRIARIRNELGQNDEAWASNDRSIELYEQLREAGNNSIDLKLGLAKAYFWARRYDDNVALCEEILETDPLHADTRSTLARTFDTLSSVNKDDVGDAAALAYHRQALALREALVQEFPDNADYLAALGGTLINLGVLLDRQGKPREALALFERGNQYIAEAYGKSPQTILWGRWLCIGLRNVANLQKSFGEQDAALKSFQRAVDVRRRLAFENPAVPSLKGELHKAWVDLGKYQRDLKLAQQANRSYRAARDVLENIPRETPNELIQLAMAYGKVATRWEGTVGEPNAEELAEQQRNADLAMETVTRAVKQGYRNVTGLRTWSSLAVIREREEFQQLVDRLEKEVEAEQLAASDPDSDDQKLTDRRQAADVLQDLIGNDPAEVRHKRTLAATLHSIGEIQTGLGQFEEAQQSLQEALEGYQSLLQQQPGDPQAALAVLEVQYSLGRWDWVQGIYAQAHDHWRAALDELRQLAEAHREDRELQQELSIQERRIYQHYARIGLFPVAREYVARVVEFERLWPTDTGDIASEGEISVVVLDSADEELARAYLQQFAESITSGDDTLVYEAMHLVRGIAATGFGELFSEDFIEQAHSLFDEKPNHGWIAVGKAMIDYHYGRYADAEVPLQRFRDGGSNQSSQIEYLKAAIAAKSGDTDRARQLWAEAEARYAQESQEALERGVSDDSQGVFADDWFHFAYAQVMRRTAIQAVDGESAGVDPWQHLIQARGYLLIGETELAEAELAAATAAAPNDLDVLLARVRLLETSKGVERIEAEWQTLLDVAGDDPLPWIHRGRWYAQQGEQEKADADFAHAASLTPGELNKFLEAGWWVAGPYPDDLDRCCPPELDTDPSQPVYAVGPTKGLSDEPIPWGAIPTGQNGNVDLPGRRGLGEDSSVYLLAYVYSPDERTALIRVGNANGVRVWWNGRLVLESDERLADWPRALRVPVALRQGRNRLLVRTRVDRALTVDLGDSPAGRFYTLTEQGRWQDAVDLSFASGRNLFLNELNNGQARPYTSTLWMASAVGDDHLVEREQRRLLNLALDLDAWSDQVHAALTLIVAQDLLTRQQAAEIMVTLEQQLPRWDSENAMRNYALRGLVLYAALLGDERVDDYLKQMLRSEKYGEHGAPIRAAIAWHRGDRSEAERELEAGLKFWEQTTHQWYRRVWNVAVLRHVERQLHGTTERTDALVATVAEAATRLTEDMDPPTSAYDHLVFTYRTISSEKTPAYPYLMRGRRLAELGRLAEAEADFDKAVELAPDSPEAVVARASFLADLGKLEQAATGFDEALSLVSVSQGRWRAPIDVEVARREEVFERLIARRPACVDLWASRVLVLISDGELDAAAAATHRAGPAVLSNYSILEMLAILRGDQDELRLLRSTHSYDDPLDETFGLGLAPTDEETTIRLLDASKRMLRRSDNRQSRFLAAVAQYRAGNMEAARTLESTVRTSGAWPIDGVAYPVLAMIHHRLGNSATARRWLDKSAFWLRIHAVGALRSDSGALGASNAVLPEWVLSATVYDREARALIASDEAIPTDDLTAAKAVSVHGGTEEPETPDP